ncbi:MAG: glycosyltransferase family protein [Candidatus Omnitrophica bacterium]|nr:glycosyltransferase family protein [Candidatus Omnitrophota bacterium]
MAERKVIAIVQARMGSTRLPGKVLIDIAEKPMLWHVLDRLRHAHFVHDVMVATSINKKDNAIERFCRVNNLNCYRGSEEDVLDRYYQAARVEKADIVVRITADCPLTDPKIVDKVISAYVKNAGSFQGSSNVINRTYPRGLDTEVISFSALEQAWGKAKKPYQREHATTYIYEHPEEFKMYSVENGEDLSLLRWTVDEESDLCFVREIYKRLWREGKVFLIRDVLAALEKEPYLKEINSRIKQKKVGV